MSCCVDSLNVNCKHTHDDSRSSSENLHKLVLIFLTEHIHHVFLDTELFHSVIIEQELEEYPKEQEEKGRRPLFHCCIVLNTCLLWGVIVSLVAFLCVCHQGTVTVVKNSPQSVREEAMEGQLGKTG